MNAFLQTCLYAAMGALAGLGGMPIGVSIGQATAHRPLHFVMAGILLTTMLVCDMVGRLSNLVRGRNGERSRHAMALLMCTAIGPMYMGVLLGHQGVPGNPVWLGLALGALFGGLLPWGARMSDDTLLSKAGGGGFLGGFLGFFLGAAVSCPTVLLILQLNGILAGVIIVWWIATYVAAGVFIGVKLGSDGLVRAVFITVGGTIMGTALTLMLGWLTPSLFPVPHGVLVCCGLIGGTALGALLSLLWACWHVFQRTGMSEAME